MWPKDLGIDVSRESLEKLEIYHQLLLKWQRAINLVGPKTIDEAWVRHFADSAQLSRYISRETLSVMDWGSGAGFPAMVLAILRPEIVFHIVESDERKCQFVRTVSRETDVPIRIYTSRIETLNPADIQADLITARALASVEKLLDYATPCLGAQPDLEILLLKGENVEAELSAAQKHYDFQVEKHQSVTDSQAHIIRLTDIKER